MHSNESLKDIFFKAKKCYGMNFTNKERLFVHNEHLSYNETLGHDKPYVQTRCPIIGATIHLSYVYIEIIHVFSISLQCWLTIGQPGRP